MSSSISPDLKGLLIDPSKVFLPIKTDRASSISISPVKLNLLMHSLASEINENRLCAFFLSKKTVQILSATDDVLKKIHKQRGIIRKGVPLCDLDKCILKVETNITQLKKAIHLLYEQIEAIGRKKDISDLKDLIACGNAAFLIEGDKTSLANALTDAPTKDMLLKNPQEFQVETDLSLLKNALEALEQYKRILRAFQEAKAHGHRLPDIIEIPFHLNEINNRIYFFGEHFKNFRFVGEGAWGEILRCTLGDKTYAIKQSKFSQSIFEDYRVGAIQYDNKDERDAFIGLLLSHRNIVQMSGIHAKQSPIRPQHCPILEFIPGGNLAENFNKSNFSDDESLDILYQISSGIEHMHEKQIIHKDLKPQNIMIDKSNPRPRAVIIDFGSSCPISKAQSLSGTEEYMAPELLSILAKNRPQIRKAFLEADITEKVDVWAMGHIIYQFATGGNHLFHDKKIGKKSKKCVGGKTHTGFPSICYTEKEKFTLEYLAKACEISQKKSRKGIKDEALRDSLLTLASKCLQKKTSERISIQEVKDVLEALILHRA
jgi:serine/threonine protein kinase